MSSFDINSFIGDLSLSLVDVMAKIDKNAKGILFVVDCDSKLTGCITDGDIRRWLIATGDLSANVSCAMNSSPVFLTDFSTNKAKEIITSTSIMALPVVDSNKQITDIIFAEDILGKNKKVNYNLSDVSVIIMAGGKGTRLYPYTRILPKPLIPIGDTPIVERIINKFSDFGINDYFLTVNYRKSMIKSYFSELEHDYNITFIEETKPLGTGGSIKLIDRKFEKPVFVTNCDTLILADYSDIYNHHLNSGNDITIVSSIKNITVPYGTMVTDDDGKLVGLKEKPKLSYLVNTGMYIVNPDVLNLIPDDTFFHMTHLVEKVLSLNMKAGMYPISEDSFLDMGEFKEMSRMKSRLNIEEE